MIEAFRQALFAPPASPAPRRKKTSRLDALEQRARDLEQFPERLAAALARKGNETFGHP